MLAEIPIGFWTFWLGAGLVLYVTFAWTTIRLAVRWDDRRGEQAPPGGEHATKALDNETEGSAA